MRVYQVIKSFCPPTKDLAPVGSVHFKKSIYKVCPMIIKCVRCISLLSPSFLVALGLGLWLRLGLGCDNSFCLDFQAAKLLSAPYHKKQSYFRLNWKLQRKREILFQFRSRLLSKERPCWQQRLMNRTYKETLNTRR